MVIPLSLAGTIPSMWALLSVSDKRGLLDFARGLLELGFRLLATGGTYRALVRPGFP